MKTVTLTCIECPRGCLIEVSGDGRKIENINGYSCLRGKKYAETEITEPKRIITSTVRAENGVMVSVKTDKPVDKSEIFNVMKKINSVYCKLPVKIGDILYTNIYKDVNLVSTCNYGIK